MTDITDENISATPSSGKEILDATQNAVIEVMENVSGIIEVKETPKEEAAVVPDISHPPFYAETEFWVGVSFVVLVIALFKTMVLTGKKLLQKKVDGIVGRINNAVELRDDAQKLLAEYERKFLSAEHESKEIESQIQSQIKLLQQESMAQMRNEINKQAADAENRINIAVNNAKAEITDVICDMSIDIIEQICRTQITQKEKDKLIDQSIEMVATLK